MRLESIQIKLPEPQRPLQLGRFEVERAPESFRSSSSMGELFESIDKEAGKIYFEADLLPKGVDEKKARDVINLRHYSGIDPTDREYDGLLTVAMTKANIERQLLRKTLEGENNLGLNATESTVLLAACDIADQHDMLYWQWKQKVMTSPLGQKLRDMGAEKANKSISDRLPEYAREADYLYVTYDENADGTISITPYSEAFSDPISAMGRTIDTMNAKLAATETEDEAEQREKKALMRYFGAYKNAITSKEPRELEELYTKVDEAWLDVQGRMQPIHMMEAYDDPAGLLVVPDFGLAFKDERYDQVNEQSDRTKRELITFLKKDFGDKASLGPSIQPMESSLAGVFAIMGSGSRLDSSISGQNVPNRAEVRLDKGVKIFIDINNMRLKEGLIKENLTRVFGEDTVAEYFDDSRITSMHASIGVAGHEVAHNAFIRKETQAKIGGSAEQNLEEAKADLASMALAPEFLDDTDLNLIARGHLGWSTRMLSYRDQPSSMPYYNAALVYMNAFEESGVVKHDTENDTWEYDESPEKIRGFFKNLRGAFGELVDVYETLDPEKAQDFRDKHFKKTSFTKAFEKRMGL